MATGAFPWQMKRREGGMAIFEGEERSIFNIQSLPFPFLFLPKRCANNKSSILK
jgi:hypothetical protein